MRVFRLALVLICCSTLENSTNSLVNELASIGLLGSWFFNWVISRLRKLPKFADSAASEFGADDAVAGVAADADVAEGVTGVIAKCPWLRGYVQAGTKPARPVLPLIRVWAA